MVDKLHIDFETRSAVDLKRTGVEIYSKDPSTDAWCMGYAFNDEPVELWEEGDVLPQRVIDHVKSGGIVIAHNAPFEWHIWNFTMSRYGWPELKIEQMVDTMAMCYAMSLPGSLDNASGAVGLQQQKDMTGHRLMLKMAKPRRIEADGTIVWWNDAEHRAKLYDYCKQDVEVERQLELRLRPLSDKEQKLWVLDQKINQRGVPVDRAAITGALDVVSKAKQIADEQMKRLTDNFVGSVSNVNQLTDWLRNQGVETNGVAKADIAALLDGDLPSPCRPVLELRQSAAKTSNAKLDAMLDACSDDDTVKQTLQYHGAGTGRWAGRKIQTQNFPRPTLKQREIEMAIPYLEAGDIDAIDMLFDSPLETVSSCLRGMIAARPGHRLIAADYSAIEARGLAWLAGQESVLEVFRTHGMIYEQAASGIYRVPVVEVNKDQRQIGKVASLALGYQGGVGAFQTMARAYGVKVSDAKADEIKVAWREDNPDIVQYWYALENAAIQAVLDPGRTTEAGAQPVHFKVAGSFLWCKLPSGRLLCYPYPRIIDKETPWGDLKPALVYKGVNQLTRKWCDIDTYGGKLAENITQAICRDLLAEALVRLDDRGYKTVFHVHDEVVCEMPNGQGSLEEMAAIMAEVPDWAAGMPISAEGWEGKRFRK